MRKTIIAIDGYSACGKSTTAKEVGRILGYRYIDSGAMYRAVTLYFQQQHIAITNPLEVSKALKVIKISFIVNAQGVSETYLQGLNVEDPIRSMAVSHQVSQVSALRDVRIAMVALQRKMGKEKGIVMDGRDIGTVVFPHADVKVFFTADVLVRAFRRQKELLDKSNMVEIDTIVDNLLERDNIDSTRKESPLKKADHATVIDTTFISVDEQVDIVVRLAIAAMINV